MRRVIARALRGAFLLALLAPAHLTGQRAARPPAMPTVERNLMESLASHREFSTFTQLVRQAGLSDTLRTWGPFTVFAPTNAAFAQVPEAALERLRGNRRKLRALVLRHVLLGSAFRHHLVGLEEGIMVSGDTLRIAPARGSIRLDDRATVVAWNLRASNGAIHTVNRVLLSRPRTRSAVATRAARVTPP